MSVDAEARARAAQGLVDQVGRQFLQQVHDRQGNRLAVSDEVLAGGGAWLAADALRMGLIDEVVVVEDPMARDFPGLEPLYFRPQRHWSEWLDPQVWVESAAATVNASFADGGLQM